MPTLSTYDVFILFKSFLTKQKLSTSDWRMILQYVMLVKNLIYQAPLYTELCHITAKLNELDWADVISDVVQSSMNTANPHYSLCIEITKLSQLTEDTEPMIGNPNHPHPFDCTENNLHGVMANSSKVSDTLNHGTAITESKCCNTNSLSELYIPEFRMKYQDWNQFPPVDYAGVIKGYDWLTTELYNEITTASPLSTDISCGGHNNRDPVECAKAAKKLFPIGRVFSSPEQIDQMLIKFSHKWGFKKTHPGNFLGCYYGTSVHTKSRGKEFNSCGNPVKKRKTHSIKCGCEFKITYKSIDMYNRQHDGVRVPKIYFNAVITKANYVHICELSTQSHRKAIISSGGIVFNLEGLTVPITLLRTNPRVSTKILRPYLQKYLTFYK